MKKIKQRLNRNWHLVNVKFWKCMEIELQLEYDLILLFWQQSHFNLPQSIGIQKNTMVQSSQAELGITQQSTFTLGQSTYVGKGTLCMQRERHASAQVRWKKCPQDGLCTGHLHLLNSNTRRPTAGPRAEHFTECTVSVHCTLWNSVHWSLFCTCTKPPHKHSQRSLKDQRYFCTNLKKKSIGR